MEANSSEDAHESSPDSDAIFIGWQQTGSGDHFALYVVTAADHPSHGSTVSEKGLHKLGLQIPETPHREGLFFSRQRQQTSEEPSDDT
jgi:hypothetical protein